MKLFRIFIVSYSSILLSQNLVFFNDEESIIFKENELITINGKEYRYEKALKNRTQIRLLKSGFLKKENILLDTNKIETFRTHKVRFSGRNAFRMAFSGFKKGFTYAGALGLGLGLNWEGKGGPKPSITNRVIFGLGFGVLAGTYFGGCGALIGLVNGFFSKGESALYNLDYYRLKFDDKMILSDSTDSKPLHHLLYHQ
jgi:hypothetical protein